ncbi:hypothetical protein [Streptomyces sp. NPDC051554]|uniref:hypothetical protein n=1 Tax=Streptomyces sp. NPDC051554 TaxID=3365656 RepID=UPI00379BDCFA
MADGSDSRAWGSSDAKDTVSRTAIVTGGGHQDTCLVIAHRRERAQAELSARREERNRSHRKARSRAQHAFAWLDVWKITKLPPTSMTGRPSRQARHRRATGKDSDAIRLSITGLAWSNGVPDWVIA